MQRVSLMSCYRIERDAVRLRDQLRSLQQLRYSGLRTGVVAAHKPTFDAMLDDVLALQARLEGQIRDVNGYTAVPEQGRRFVETARSILEDTGLLIELLIWLGAG